MIETRAVRRCDRCSVEMGEVTPDDPATVPGICFEMRLPLAKLSFVDLCDPCIDRLKTLMEQAGPVSRPGRKKGAGASAPVQLNDEVIESV